MATYGETRNLFDNSALRNKIGTAVIVAAQNILTEITPAVKRKAWAAKAFADPNREAKRSMMSVLAANISTPLATIMEIITNDNIANNDILQGHVDAAIDLFIDADAGV